MLKVGISAIGYECAEHLNDVLAPWVELRKSCLTRYEFFISVSHGVFPETHKLGFPLYSTDGTIARLNEKLAEKSIDNLVVTDRPTFERDLRNHTLPYLFDQNIDLLWLLDLQDEIYTPAQILNTLEFIEKSDEDWFKINFKNYVFDEYTFVDDFIAPRIWRINTPKDKVAGFYYDNDIIYDSGRTHGEHIHTVIPRDIAFVKHLSWVGSKAYLQRKIGFQKIHYGQCSYKWDDAQGRLIFDEDYYAKNNVAKPTVYHD
jgi:hypothetical protein